MHFENSTSDGSTQNIPIWNLHSEPRKSKCNLRIPSGIIQKYTLQNLHYEKKKWNCYSTVPFRVYTQLESHLQNEKAWNQIIIRTFHFSLTNHQKIDKESIASPNNKGQLKTFYCEQRKSKCSWTTLFMIGQLKIYSWNLHNEQKKSKCNLRIASRIIQKKNPYGTSLWKEKKSNCYPKAPFRVYTLLKSYLQNKKVWNQIIIQISSTLAQQTIKR